MRILLATPPMTQLNTPYPATAYLTGFLRQHAARLDIEVEQADLAIELFLRVFSRAGIQRVLGELTARAGLLAADAAADDDPDGAMPRSVASFLAHGERWRPYRSVASWYLWRATDQAP